MKKLFTFAVTMLLGAGLTFAQATGGTPKSTDDKTPKAATGKKATKTKAHKGGKKGKKSSSTTTTQPPK
jgi:hypothetical protein